GKTARQICAYYLRVAWDNATFEEKNYLPLIQKRVEKGSLSEIILEKVKKKAQKTSLREAVLHVYLSLIKSLENNEPYF
ncbi:MAG: hypothetical protein QXJ02_05880, partial [Candidatus Bathyarchaeia archaeon]